VAAFAVAGPLGAFVTVVVVVLRPRLRNIAVRRTHARELAASMPTFVDLLVLAIRSGYSPPLALAAVEPVVPGPLQPAVAEVVRRLALGERFADAVGALPSLVGPEAQPLTDALVTASRYGHPLGPVLDRLATEARMARRQQAEAAVKQLPIRLAFPLAMCILPGFALLSVVPLLGGTLSSLRLTS
jgi:tight adherence protein C